MDLGQVLFIFLLSFFCYNLLLLLLFFILFKLSLQIITQISILFSLEFLFYVKKKLARQSTGRKCSRVLKRFVHLTLPASKIFFWCRKFVSFFIIQMIQPLKNFYGQREGEFCNNVGFQQYLYQGVHDVSFPTKSSMSVFVWVCSTYCLSGYCWGHLEEIYCRDIDVGSFSWNSWTRLIDIVTITIRNDKRVLLLLCQIMIFNVLLQPISFRELMESFVF